MDSDSILYKVLEWAWLALVALIVHIYKILFGQVTRAELLEQQAGHFQAQRAEDEMRRKEQRNELLSSIERHHKTVMDRFDKLEARIKNGH